ncbi:transketolase family protein [Chloroflexota bacterium]
MAEMTTNREAYGHALVALGAANPNVVVLEADLGASTYTYLFGEQFPDRYFNMGVAEANMMGTAAGLAANGKIAFASTFCIFASLRAGEQVRNSIAYPNLNVKIVATNAGIEIGPDGATHQATEDVAVMRAIPNMTVVAPSDPIMTTQLVRQAAEFEGPLYMRLGRQPTPFLYDAKQRFQFGKAIILGEGDDVTLVAMGNMVNRAIAAREILAGEGIQARVLDMHTIKPIDRVALIQAARDTGCVVTAEDHNVIGGLGGAVAEVLSAEQPVPVVRVGVQDTFAQSGETEELFEFYGMTPVHLADAARKAMRLRDSL